jgi:hypothetical protein
MERRTFIRGACSLGIGSLLLARPGLAQTLDPPGRPERGLVERIRRHAPTRLGVEGLDPLAQQALLHQQFPLVIENNFALMGRAHTAAFLGSETPGFLASLFERYRLANLQQGREELLLPLLAHRLDLRDLAALAPYTGAEPMFAALSQLRPADAAPYLELAGEVLARHPESGVHAVGGLAGAHGMQSGEFLDHTIHEIYLSFRTAPVGALSARAAAYETAHLVGRHLFLAFSVGYGVGSYMAPVIERHAPGLWHGIGHWVHIIVEAYRELTRPEDKGRMQKNSAEGFALGLNVRHELFNHGGDYHVVYELPRLINPGLPCFSCSTH